MTPCRRFTPAMTVPWNSCGATISTAMMGSRMAVLAFSIAEESAWEAASTKGRQPRRIGVNR
ncbi:hypothetical protein EYF80_009429 [Liparis tanakae]|uniref:Uncharacterized protein n=1 Tax=Liparis tanakae TaxID=230148 RepID=A0A4Z2IR51_9TELE|nr:hypothetical protein EYF80_009429 [Liparis tanakae]